MGKFVSDATKQFQAGKRLLALASQVDVIPNFNTVTHEHTDECQMLDNGSCITVMEQREKLDKWFKQFHELESTPGLSKLAISKVMVHSTQKWRTSMQPTSLLIHDRRLDILEVDPYPAIRFEVASKQFGTTVTVWKTVRVSDYPGSEPFNEAFLEPSKFTSAQIFERATAIYMAEKAKADQPMTNPEPEELEENGLVEQAKEELSQDVDAADYPKPIAEPLPKQQEKATEPLSKPTVSTQQSVKAVRVRSGGNLTFKHLTKELWQITAKYSSICSTCKGIIHVGEEITMFKGTPGWSHMEHSIPAQVAVK